MSQAGIAPPPSSMKGVGLELGNYIKVSKQAIIQSPGQIVRLCVFNCLKACEEYRIEPVGSFEMGVVDVGEPWAYVRYSFISDE